MADDADLTPRERRRNRAANNPRAKGDGAEVWRRYKVHVIILLLTAGLATAMAVNASQTKECPGHWHSSMDVYVNGDRVSFAHDKYRLETSQYVGGSMAMEAHMHQGDDAMWHWEPVGGADCIPLREALEVVDMELTSSRLVLSGAHEDLGQAGTYVENDTHQLSAWRRVGNGDWEEVGLRGVLGRQQLADERLIIVYGNESLLPQYQARADANTIQSSSGGQGGASYVPVVGVSIMGLVALAVWHSLAKRA